MRRRVAGVVPPQIPRSAETSIDSAASRQGCLTGQVVQTSMALFRV
jgi:hypothetical protein